MKKTTFSVPVLAVLGLFACDTTPPFEAASALSTVAPPSPPDAATPSKESSLESEGSQTPAPATASVGSGSLPLSSEPPPAPEEETADGGADGQQTVEGPSAQGGTSPGQVETPPGMDSGSGGVAGMPVEPAAGGQNTGGQNTGGQVAAGGQPTAPPAPGGAPGHAGQGGSAEPEEELEPSVGGASPAEDCISTGAAENFSFFVTSMFHILELSGSESGFGGDLRYNGARTGLEGADAICQEMARRVCHGHKTWRALLSTSEVDAIDRIGTGPWYDHAGTLVAQDVSGLAGNERPAGGCCDVGTLDELGELHDGVNNGDDHDTLTGSNAQGRLDTSSSTCNDWTSTTAPGRPRLGHSWPRSPRSGRHWLMDHNAGGCAAGINIMSGRGSAGGSVGSGGGYGGFYCFAE